MADISVTFASMARNNSAIRSIANNHIYSDRIPQNVTDTCLVFWVVTELAHEHLGGPLGMDQARMQVDAYASTRSAANELARAVWQELAGFAGVVSNVFVKGVSRRSGVRHTTDRVKAGTDAYRFVATQDLLITYCSED